LDVGKNDFGRQKKRHWTSEKTTLGVIIFFYILFSNF